MSFFIPTNQYAGRDDHSNELDDDHVLPINGYYAENYLQICDTKTPIKKFETENSTRHYCNDESRVLLDCQVSHMPENSEIKVSFFQKVSFSFYHFSRSMFDSTKTIQNI